MFFENFAAVVKNFLQNRHLQQDQAGRIVDLMGHPGGEFAQSCQMGGAGRLFAQNHPLGQITGEADDPVDSTGDVAHREGLDPPGATVACPVNPLFKLSGSKGAPHLAILLMCKIDGTEFVAALADDLCAVAGAAGVGPEHPHFARPDGQRIGDAVEDRLRLVKEFLVARFALLQGLFGMLAFGDVEHGADQSAGGAVLAPEDRLAEEDVMTAAVGKDHLGLIGLGVTLAQKFHVSIVVNLRQIGRCEIEDGLADYLGAGFAEIALKGGIAA